MSIIKHQSHTVLPALPSGRGEKPRPYSHNIKTPRGMKHNNFLFFTTLWVHLCLTGSEELWRFHRLSYKDWLQSEPFNSFACDTFFRFWQYMYVCSTKKMNWSRIIYLITTFFRRQFHLTRCNETGDSQTVGIKQTVAWFQFELQHQRKKLSHKYWVQEMLEHRCQFSETLNLTALT